MQTLRCTKCGKVLLEAEGEAYIRKKCPKCKTINEFHIEKGIIQPIHKSN
ncbi:Com family DNA-binding transcriptional regulator [Clostridium felsineum]|uniref:Uncharacterized protein n=1 Tax=Clostridium felsineum TaxID=36839 RepID=A0A1S8KZV8_9CLOT|nr:Com family DNA-binding transcriptional regulator [Clostridium felsineum]URZ06473.1 hypothetical protein CLROS_018060 [Clostridium felsineum]URZ11508.1 hypothetical protein CROST_022250 [Clostridium felsineum]